MFRRFSSKSRSDSVCICALDSCLVIFRLVLLEAAFGAGAPTSFDSKRTPPLRSTFHQVKNLRVHAFLSMVSTHKRSQKGELLLGCRRTSQYVGPSSRYVHCDSYEQTHSSKSTSPEPSASIFRIARSISSSVTSSSPTRVRKSG